MKKKPTPRISTGTPGELTHSPFAGLADPTRSAGPPPPNAAGESSAGTGGSPGEPAAVPQSRGRLVLRRETQHRGGKAVVVVSGAAALPGFDARAIEALAKECKRALGCGGTVDDGEIVLQGDRPAEVAELLRSKGFRVAGVTS